MWISDIQPIVYSRVKARGSSLKKNYPAIRFTDENETDETTPVFPTVFVEELSGLESNKDLYGKTVNAYMATFQVMITHNRNKVDVRNIMDNVMETMKSMAFEMNSTPIYSLSNGVWTGVARFRRTIGAEDIL